MAIGIRDILKTSAILLLAFFTLPATLFLTIISLIATYFFPHISGTLTQRARCRANPHFRQRTILVTGVGMAKGLHLARAFWACGHRVIGADFHAGWFQLPILGYSRSLYKFVNLFEPSFPDPKQGEVDRYVRELKAVVEREKVDVWVSCSGAGTAMEDAAAKEVIDRETRCRSIQFGVEDTRKLHWKDLFTKHCQELGISVPDTYEVHSKEETLKVLRDVKQRFPSRRYVLKKLGVVSSKYRCVMEMLPKPDDRATEAFVNTLPIYKGSPWLVQQFMSTGHEYCTHSVVVEGQIKVFMACPSKDVLMHYENLPFGDPLRRQMLDFSRKLVAAQGKGFTGHLSFDFMADVVNGETQLYAIECNPRAHTALVLYSQPGKEMRQMVQGYLTVLDGRDGTNGTNGTSGSSSSSSSSSSGTSSNTTAADEAKDDPDGALLITPPPGVPSRYWLAHDVVAKLLWPTLQLLRSQIGLGGYVVGVRDLVVHVLLWREGTFAFWDPVPFLAFFYWYMPRYFLLGLWRGTPWTTANVSTHKVWWQETDKKVE